MFAVMGVTGRVGSVVARALLAQGRGARAIVRDPSKISAWHDQGRYMAVANANDAAAMTRALADVEGAFLMIPPDYDPAPGFPRVHEIVDSFHTALGAARPARVVLLSSVGAQVAEPNLLNNAGIMEQGLQDLAISNAFLRPGWFMENALWDVDSARTGVVPSFLQPLDHKIPMVAAHDIGCLAAELLLESWAGSRIVELEGPQRFSANDVAATFSNIFGHSVHMDPVVRSSWEVLFRSQGMRNPMPRIRMLDGFNEGWIDFEGGAAEHRIGRITLPEALRSLVSRSAVI